MKFVVRVDDCGWTPEKQADAGLKYFREWLHACNLDVASYPVVLAFIPATLSVNDLASLGDILVDCGRTGDVPRLAVHGWDHERGATVEADRMSHGLNCLREAASRIAWSGLFAKKLENIYVAPFNAYTKSTVREWSRATTGTNGLFLGGFRDDAQSVDYGPDPVVVRKNVIHVPAVLHWYDHAPPLVGRVKELLSQAWTPDDDIEPPPVVLTLHTTWDVNSFGALSELFHLIGPMIVPPESFRTWLAENNRLGGAT